MSGLSRDEDEFEILRAYMQQNGAQEAADLLHLPLSTVTYYLKRVTRTLEARSWIHAGAIAFCQKLYPGPKVGVIEHPEPNDLILIQGVANGLDRKTLGALIGTRRIATVTEALQLTLVKLGVTSRAPGVLAALTVWPVKVEMPEMHSQIPAQAA